MEGLFFSLGGRGDEYVEESITLTCLLKVFLVHTSIRAPSSSFFLGPLNKKAKSVVLHIKGLTSQVSWSIVYYSKLFHQC